jgi:Outer membrane protein beta-barrel domain
MKQLLVVSLAFAFSLTGVADDLMIIKGGREIHGRLMEENPTHIFFYTDYGKKIQVHKSRISVILRNGEVMTVNPVVGSATGMKIDPEVMQDSGPPHQTETQEPITSNGEIANQSERGVASNLVAQATPEKSSKVRVGVTLGLTESGSSAQGETGSRAGAEAGVIGEFPMPFIPLPDLFFQSGLLLSQAGYAMGDTTIKYNYLKVPLLGKYKYFLSDRLALVGMMGPSLGYRAQATSESSSGVVTDIKSTTKTLIYGWDLSAGAEYVYSKKLAFFFNLQYGMQLNNLDTTIGATTAIKLHQLGVLTGFLFTI